jgi:4-hydroxybenzoate polyprenyltransferase
VSPDGALLLAAALYMAVLIMACLLSATPLRVIIASAAGITLAYTPWLKRLTCIKNLSVAFVIAASPLAGALSTGLVRFWNLSFSSAAMNQGFRLLLMTTWQPWPGPL